MSQLNCDMERRDAVPLNECHSSTSREPHLRPFILGFRLKGFRRLVSRLKGGLGHQLFIYASSVELGRRLDMPVFFDTTSAFQSDPFGRTLALPDLDISFAKATAIESFSIPGGALLRRALHHREWRRPVEQRHYIYQGADSGCSMLECQRKRRWLYLDGYWQDFNFFHRNYLALINVIQQARARYASELRGQHEVRTVGVHVRQRIGYSASGGAVFNATGMLVMDYYLAALREVLRCTSPGAVKLFGDDFAFRKELAFLIQSLFGISAEIMEGSSAVIDLIQMSSCSALVLSNSTFAWWAGYLNTAASKIMHPGVDIGGSPFWTPSTWHILDP